MQSTLQNQVSHANFIGTMQASIEGDMLSIKTQIKGKIKPMPEQLFTERKAAVELQISRMSLRKYRKAGVINPIVTHFTVLYSADSLNEFKARYIVRKGKSLMQRDATGK